MLSPVSFCSSESDIDFGVPTPETVAASASRLFKRDLNESAAEADIIPLESPRFTCSFISSIRLANVGAGADCKLMSVEVELTAGLRVPIVIVRFMMVSGCEGTITCFSTNVGDDGMTTGSVG